MEVITNIIEGAVVTLREGIEAAAQLSGGEQQRLCIARALINQPQILLADEPTGNLDEHNARVVLQLFQELHRNGHTIVLVTHDADVGRLADRRILFEHGRMVRTPRDEFAANEEEYCTHDPVPMYGRN